MVQPVEGAGHLGHVLLGVAAIYAERMKFHQFPAVIFVQAPLLFFCFAPAEAAGRGG